MIEGLKTKADLRRFVEWELQRPGNRSAAVSGGSGGGGAVESVNGKTGIVTLEASDVGADASGAAGAARGEAEAAAKAEVKTERERAEGVEAAKQSTSEKGKANGYAELEAAGKVPVSQLPSAIMEYQGTWNASSNTPKLEDGKGGAGDVYRVSVAGEHNFGSGAISFDVGDYAIYNGATWEKSDTTDSVASVAGKKGNVSLAVADVEGAESTANKDNDSTLAADSATKYPTQHAVKDYVTTQAGLLVPKSAIETDSSFATANDEKVPSAKAVKTALALKANASDLPTIALLKEPVTIKEKTELVDLPGLEINLTKSETEVLTFEALLVVEAANSTMKIKIGFGKHPGGGGGGGTTLAGAWGVHVSLVGYEAGGIGAATTATTTPNYSQFFTSAEEVSRPYATRASDTGSPIFYVVRGMIFGRGTAGTIKMRFAQNASNPGNLSAHDGSFMEIRKLRA